jgi:hypothetical protein
VTRQEREQEKTALMERVGAGLAPEDGGDTIEPTEVDLSLEQGPEEIPLEETPEERGAPTIADIIRQKRRAALEKARAAKAKKAIERGDLPAPKPLTKREEAAVGRGALIEFLDKITVAFWERVPVAMGLDMLAKLREQTTIGASVIRDRQVAAEVPKCDTCNAVIIGANFKHKDDSQFMRTGKSYYLCSVPCYTLYVAKRSKERVARMQKAAE